MTVMDLVRNFSASPNFSRLMTKSMTANSLTSSEIAWGGLSCVSIRASGVAIVKNQYAVSGAELSTFAVSNYCYLSRTR